MTNGSTYRFTKSLNAIEEGGIMKKTIIALLCIVAHAGTAFALRCGNELISVGDLKNEVRVACGEPISKEIIGYVDHVVSETNDGQTSEKRIRVMKIEEWIIETTSYGTTYFHSLEFEGNKLIEIKDAGQKRK
jgi:hypothetical protein